jgi:hypothetical protein
MTWDYNKMEEFNMQQQITITNLEQTCQEPKEQQVVAHIKFKKEKINFNCPNLGLEMSI